MCGEEKEQHVEESAASDTQSSNGEINKVNQEKF